MLRRMFYIGTS